MKDSTTNTAARELLAVSSYGKKTARTFLLVGG